MRQNQIGIVMSGVRLILAFFLFVIIAAPLPVSAQKVDPATYYKDKTIEIIVPFPAGGGSDISSRFLSGWFTKFIPGNPVIIVRNMPGANTLIGANYVYKIAKKDGLTLLAASTGVNLNSLLQVKGVEYDMNKMPMVLATSSGIIQFVKANLIKNFKDIFEQEILIFGHLPPGGGNTTTFILAKELLGFKTKKLILAYGGSGDARRAFLAGETNAAGDTVQAYEAQLKSLEKSGEIKYLWQSGTLDEAGNVVRIDPPVGHIPTVYDRYVEIYGKPPSGKVWEAYKTAVGVFAVFDKSLSFPPGTPPEIVNIVSEACERLVKDPGFVTDANAKLNSRFMAGEPMRKIYNKTMVQANPEAISWLKTWLREKWGVE